jgi:hypothetical protein
MPFHPRKTVLKTRRNLLVYILENNRIVSKEHAEVYFNTNKPSIWNREPAFLPVKSSRVNAERVFVSQELVCNQKFMYQFNDLRKLSFAQNRRSF